jgi:P27 family predicted phage terminase small subunit
VWRDIGRKLLRARVLTPLDLDTVGAYGEAASLARACAATIARDGRTVSTPQGLRRHPDLTTMEHAGAAMRALGARLGLAPGDRLRLKVTTVIAASTDEDFFFGPRMTPAPTGTHGRRGRRR